MARRRGKTYWYRHIEMQLGSGLTQTDYCELEGLKLGTFRTWVYRYRDEESGLERISFVEVSTGSQAAEELEPATADVIRVWVGAAVSLELSELPPPAYLAALAIEVVAAC